MGLKPWCKVGVLLCASIALVGCTNSSLRDKSAVNPQVNPYASSQPFPQASNGVNQTGGLSNVKQPPPFNQPPPYGQQPGGFTNPALPVPPSNLGPLDNSGSFQPGPSQSSPGAGVLPIQYQSNGNPPPISTPPAGSQFGTSNSNVTYPQGGLPAIPRPTP